MKFPEISGTGTSNVPFPVIGIVLGMCLIGQIFTFPRPSMMLCQTVGEPFRS
jgi:hypothetical protein